jgi:ferritin-like protein
MAGSSDSYHEPLEDITEETRTLHQAIVSLQEELEAVDWYRQRADACKDEDLKAVLLHNMREELEHACMCLEWLRRNNSDFQHYLKEYLFTDGPIVDHH